MLKYSNKPSRFLSINAIGDNKTSNKVKNHLLRSRLHIMLNMLNNFCQEKASVIPEIQQISEEIAIMQQLQIKKALTNEQLQNLLEHCKFIFLKYAGIFPRETLVHHGAEEKFEIQKQVQKKAPITI